MIAQPEKLRTKNLLNIIKEIGIKDMEPVSVVCLGSKISLRGRLMCVQVGSLNIKRALLSNTKKLRNIQSVQIRDAMI